MATTHTRHEIFTDNDDLIEIGMEYEDEIRFSVNGTEIELTIEDTKDLINQLYSILYVDDVATPEDLVTK